jgi:hypothetical protein
MKIQLNDFEKALLNRIIPTQTLSDSKGIQIALRNFIGDEREQIMQERGLNEQAFRALQSQSVNNIFQYLKDYEYIGEREGAVHFLTEKGKNLRRQGSLENYAEWQKATRAKNKVIINTIETRGYLDQDEIIRNRRKLLYKRLKKFVVYPIVLIILFLFLVLGAHHYKLDDNIPFIKNMFNKEEPTKESETKKNSNKKSHNSKKHK